MVELKPVNLNSTKVETLIVPVCEDREIHTNKTVIGLEKSAKYYPEFKGKSGDRITLFKPEGTRITRVIFMGLGKNDDKLNAESFALFPAEQRDFSSIQGLLV